MPKRVRRGKPTVVQLALRAACQLVGGQAELAVQLETSVPTLSRWGRAGKVQDAAAAVRLSKLSGYPVDQLAGVAGAP